MDLNTFEHHSTDTATRGERLKLIGLSAGMLLAGAALAVAAGPPRVPARPWSADELLAALSGSTIPFEALLLVLVDVSWLLWAWIVGSLSIELLMVAAETLAAGATWVGSMRRLAHRFTAPMVRRSVAAAFAVQMLTRSVPIAAAQTLPSTEQTIEVSDPQAIASEPDAVSAPTYLVRAGDTLWSIAERAYGSGTEYRQLIDANLGQRMPDGRVFTAQGVIQPGWRLLVPGATWGIQQMDGHRWYVVQPGDTLSVIAASALGDSARWQDLFALNVGCPSVDGTHALADPDVIWPGMQLQLPDPPAPGDPQPDAPPAAEPDDTSIDLVVASAAPVAKQEPSPEPAEAALPPESAPPPLVRTPHALDPVILQPADTPPADAASDAPATIPPQASSAGDADLSLPSPPLRPDIPTLPLAAGGLGLAAVAGLAFGARRRRRLQPLPKEPENEIVVQGGFAEAELAHDLTRGLHGVGFDAASAVVGRIEQFLAEYNLHNVGVVCVRHGRSSTTVALRCSLAEQAILVDLATVFGERLDAVAEAVVNADQDVVLRLDRLRKTRLLPSADAAQSSACIVPMGVLYDRQVYSAAWQSLGHVLVASLPGHGADTILTSLVATLTSRRSPEQLRLWVLASRRALPAPMFELPHLTRVADPDDEAALAGIVDDLRAELDRRALEPPQADLAIVLPELTQLGEHAVQFALLAERAAHVGVHLLAASTCLDELLTNPLTTHFVTRMVLRMHAEEASVALLGVADATLLGGGGRLLLRLDGREPVELYGYQVSAEHLERLVRLMRSAYSSRPDAPSAPPVLPDAAQPPEPPTLPEPAESPPNTSDPTGPAATDTASLQAPETLDSHHPTARRPPIEVLCFGGPHVLCGGQQVWPHRAAGDAKPWEFLLYLACQPAEGVSRDEAVEALWPEDREPDAAPHRFRQLRYRLRRLLTAVPGAPPSEGVCFERGVLRIDPGIVYSDVQEFLELLRTARNTSEPGDAVEALERARALYIGDLLEGPDARRYAWLDERGASGVTLREHFRRQFEVASTRLAELYLATGAQDAAVELYRELTDIDPGDERLWQALFRVHAERRDRPALMRELQRLRESLRALADDSDEADSPADEPSTEIMREYEQLLSSVSEREREPAGV